MAAEAETEFNLKVVPYVDLKAATANFSSSVCGSIFKGWVKEETLAPCAVGTGIAVAVKRFDRGNQEDDVKWETELHLGCLILQTELHLGMAPHDNLVKLLGYCDEKKKKSFLVYQFVRNGSLPNHLFRKFLREKLDWDERLNIAIGAAQGLKFLHSLQIIHRDVKPTAILIDEIYSATLSRNVYNTRISNFHLAIKKPADEELYMSAPVCGTVGYIDPEYMISGKLSMKSDVYSFGVVLLQILTGLMACDYSQPQERISLVDWAIPLLSHKTKLQTITDADKHLYISEEAKQTAKLAQKCLKREPQKRPSMEAVVKELEQIRSNRTPRP